MAKNPLSFLKDIFSKLIDAAGKLPPLLAFAIFAGVLLLAGAIGMTLLQVSSQNNIIILVGVVLVLALIATFLIEFRKPADAARGKKDSPPVPAERRGSAQFIYDSTKTDSVGFDFKGRPSAIFKGSGAEAKPITESGRGEVIFEDDGILSIHRENREGRYELKLLHYVYRGEKRSSLPKNNSISGSRKLELHFEAKVSKGARHTLKAVLKNEQTEQWLATAQATISDTEWKRYRLYLPADPSLDGFLRIDDQDVSIAPSSVQIRKILLLEQSE